MSHASCKANSSINSRARPNPGPLIRILSPSEKITHTGTIQISWSDSSPTSDDSFLEIPRAEQPKIYTSNLTWKLRHLFKVQQRRIPTISSSKDAPPFKSIIHDSLKYHAEFYISWRCGEVGSDPGKVRLVVKIWVERRCFLMKMAIRVEFPGSQIPKGWILRFSDVCKSLQIDLEYYSARYGCLRNFTKPFQTFYHSLVQKRIRGIFKTLHPSVSNRPKGIVNVIPEKLETRKLVGKDCHGDVTCVLYLNGLVI